MKRKILIGAGFALALVAAFLGGRFSRPVKVVEKVKVETKTEYVDRWKEKIVYVEAKTTTKHVETRTEKKPTGEVIVTRVEDSGSETKKSGTEDKAGESAAKVATVSETEKVTDYGRPGWRVSAMGAWSPGLTLGTPQLWGLEVQRRLFWTIWAGGVGIRVADRTYLGLSVGMEF